MVAVFAFVIPSVRGNWGVQTFTLPAYVPGQSTSVTSQSFSVYLASDQGLYGTVQSTQPVWVMIVTASDHDTAMHDGANGFNDLRSNDLSKLGEVTQLTNPNPLHWNKCHFIYSWSNVLDCYPDGQYYLVFVNTGDFSATVTINIYVAEMPQS